MKVRCRERKEGKNDVLLGVLSNLDSSCNCGRDSDSCVLFYF